MSDAERAVPTSTAAIQDLSSTAREDALVLGTCLTLVSALGYTAANVALREASRPSDVPWALWVSCIKAVPSAVIAGLLLLARRRTVWPDGRSVWVLVVTGLVMNFAGNGLFQWSLGIVGLAVAVPLIFATLIASGAILGRLVLGESVTPRTVASMALLVASITLLSVGAGEASHHGLPTSDVLLAVLAACVSGVAYGGNGVVMRRMVTGEVGVVATMGIISATGAVSLGLASLAALGPRALVAVPAREMGSMWAAGVFNAVAFFAVTAAFARAPVVWVNLVNSSQIAMCSAAGVLWFNERLTTGIISGIGLTIVGLALLARGSRPATARTASDPDLPP